MLDKGTFGTVFKAWDTKRKEFVAVKVQGSGFRVECSGFSSGLSAQGLVSGHQYWDTSLGHTQVVLVQVVLRV